MRFKTGVKIFFEEITGIRSRVLSILILKKQGSFGRFQLIYIFDLLLQMGANGAFGQELQIAPKNRFHTNFLRKIWTYHFLFSP